MSGLGRRGEGNAALTADMLPAHAAEDEARTCCQAVVVRLVVQLLTVLK